MDCGKCTLCCKVLNIKEVKSPCNEWCKYCDENGCKIYDTRPDGCKEFMCAWLQMEQAGIEMRPDKCGVVFEKFSDNVMAGATDGNIAPIVDGQIKAFNREGISVMIFNHSNKQKNCFLVEGHDLVSVEKAINDRS